MPSSECVNKTCGTVCKEDAPKGGPHCRHPLAPAKSFCDFTGNNTENWGSEWNEVVRPGSEGASWERTCAWGKSPTKPAPSLADRKAVEKVDAEAEAAHDKEATTTARPKHSHEKETDSDKDE